MTEPLWLMKHVRALTTEVAVAMAAERVAEATEAEDREDTRLISFIFNMPERIVP